jgi:hypothetical protein
MLTKTVVGRKILNAMLRHLAFHGQIEMPWRGEFEHAVVTQLVADRKAAVRQGRYDDVVVNVGGKMYDESPSDGVHPLVVHLALENPRNEELAKVFRKNHAVPVLREVEPEAEGWDYL